DSSQPVAQGLSHRSSNSGREEAGVLCVRPNCHEEAWDLKKGSFCSYSCLEKQAGQQAFCSLASESQLASVVKHLNQKWDTQRGAVPQPRKVYRIYASAIVENRYWKRCRAIGDVKAYGHGANPGNQQRRPHGTGQKCKFSGQPCTDKGCRACSIIREGFDLTHLGEGTGNQGYYGPGHYTTSQWATAKSYGNVLILANVAAGKVEKSKELTSSVVSPEHNSRVVEKTTGVDELVVFNDDQMLPLYLILF
ncbi:unnamed protein product, partial [Polarella glacialis]